MSLVWQVFEPLLFGLVGAEVSVEYMNSKVVGELLQWNNLNFSMVVAHLQSGFFPSPPKVNSLSLSKPNWFTLCLQGLCQNFCLFLFFE